MLAEHELQERIIKLMGSLERGEIESPSVCILCLKYAKTSPRRFGQYIAWVCEDCDPIYRDSP